MQFQGHPTPAAGSEISDGVAANSFLEGTWSMPVIRS
jgi:hypothetical protein